MPYKNQHPLYSVWMSMKNRCYTPTNRQWKDYGGRGIAVCARWLESNNQGFKNFVADMGARPAGLTLDRINNNENYSPENCRWATRKEQQRNQSVTRKVTIEGREYIAAELAEIAGIKTDTLVARAAKGLSYSEVMSPERRVTFENLALGGRANGAKQAAKTHCPHGHEYTPENTYVSIANNSRRCRACAAAREKAKRALAAFSG